SKARGRRFYVATKDPNAERMKRGQERSRTNPLTREQPGNPRFHLACGLVGEGYREDLLGSHASLSDEMDDTMSDDACLARSSARKHQDRTILALDSLDLLLIEAVACSAMQHLLDQRLYCFELR